MQKHLIANLCEFGIISINCTSGSFEQECPTALHYGFPTRSETVPAGHRAQKKHRKKAQGIADRVKNCCCFSGYIIGGQIHMEVVHRNPLLTFSKSDFPGRRDTEPWMAHIAKADWTEGHYQVLHRHEDFSEIFILLEGSGKYTIGGRLYELNEGDIVLCNQGVLHDEFPAKGNVYKTLAVGISGLYIPELRPGLLIDPSRTPVLRRSEQTQEVQEICMMMEKYAVSGEGRNLRFVHKLLLAVIELLRSIVRSVEISSKEVDPLCVAVEQYLNEHFGENVTLEETAKQFFVSSWHLSRVFKKETSYNFKQYLLRLRLGEAQMRLSSTEDSIAEISRDCGFHDPAYFTRLFTRHIGLSPRRYRKMRLQDRE